MYPVSSVPYGQDWLNDTSASVGGTFDFSRVTRTGTRSRISPNYPYSMEHASETDAARSQRGNSMQQILSDEGRGGHQSPGLAWMDRLMRKLQTLDLACSTVGGTFDESGKCNVCIGENCFILEADLTAFSAEFCTTTKYPGFDETTYCGSASCYVDFLTIKCEATIPILDSILQGSANCNFGLSCDCVEATWDGEKCTNCFGAADGYDCSNVGGPVKLAALPPVINLPRNYRSNWFFQMAVNQKTTPEASLAAGVPLGGAVTHESWQLLSKFVPKDYTSFTPENAMKWNSLLRTEDVLGIYDFTDADRYVDYAVSAGVQIRGHVMLWGTFEGQSYPVAVRTQVEASDDPRRIIIDIMRDHIHTVGLHFGDVVGCWDVVNEHMISQNDGNIFYQTLGDDYVKIAFELAREVLPDTPLVWNEVFSDFSLSSQRVVDWIDLLKQYKNEAVPIDRIGVQGHIYNSLHNIDDLQTFFQVVAQMGYGIEVTEYDAPIAIWPKTFFTDPFQQQADYTAAYLQACLDSGRCEGFTFWGLSDSFSWFDKHIFPDQAPNLPLMIDEEGYSKPAWLRVRKTLEAYASPPTFFDSLFDGVLSLFANIFDGFFNVWDFSLGLFGW